MFQISQISIEQASKQRRRLAVCVVGWLGGWLAGRYGLLRRANSVVWECVNVRTVLQERKPAGCRSERRMTGGWIPRS